jgi:SnoaL-like domain
MSCHSPAFVVSTRQHSTPRRGDLVRLAATALCFVAMAFLAGRVSAAERSLAERVQELEQRLQSMEDQKAIEKLTRAYGYYLDKALWSEVIPLFADDAEVEISNRGLYRGRKGVQNLFLQVLGKGREGLADGALFNHLILQGIVDVAPSGDAAAGRWRAFMQIGQWQKTALWAEGTYQVTYVKRKGVWQFHKMQWFGTFFSPYEQGWAKAALGNNAASTTFPPDAPPTRAYDALPGHYVPPFPYPNPVTGRVWTEEDTRKFSTQGLNPDTPANQRGTGSPPESTPR